MGSSSTRTQLESNVMTRTEVVHTRLSMAELLANYVHILESEGWERIGGETREQVAWSVDRLKESRPTGCALWP